MDKNVNKNIFGEEKNMECTLYLTDSCNLKCSYCYEGDSKNSIFLTEEKLRLALNYIKTNNPVNDDIHLTLLGGEPLLNKKLLRKVFEIINNEYKDIIHLFHYSLTTNVVFLDDEVIQLLLNNNVSLSISIDGDENTHNLNRESLNGKNVYQLIINNLKKLIHGNIPFSVRMTVTCNNVKHLYNNVIYFYNMGVKKFHIAYNEFDSWDSDSLTQYDAQMKMLDEFYIKEIVENDECLINLYDYKYTTFLAKHEIVYCSAGSKGHVTINSKGEIYPCGYVANNKYWNIGNVGEDFSDHSFIERAKNTVDPNVKKCKSCDIAFTCSGTKCGLKNYCLTGLLNVTDPKTCKLERILFEHDNAVFRYLFVKDYNRIKKYLKILKDYNLEKSDWLLKLEQEVDACTQ